MEVNEVKVYNDVCDNTNDVCDNTNCSTKWKLMRKQTSQQMRTLMFECEPEEENIKFVDRKNGSSKAKTKSRRVWTDTTTTNKRKINFEKKLISHMIRKWLFYYYKALKAINFNKSSEYK